MINISPSTPESVLHILIRETYWTQAIYLGVGAINTFTASMIVLTTPLVFWPFAVANAFMIYSAFRVFNGLDKARVDLRVLIALKRQLEELRDL